jgi:hypothetical protein
MGAVFASVDSTSTAPVTALGTPRHKPRPASSPQWRQVFDEYDDEVADAEAEEEAVRRGGGGGEDSDKDVRPVHLRGSHHHHADQGAQLPPEACSPYVRVHGLGCTAPARGVRPLRMGSWFGVRSSRQRSAAPAHGFMV